MRLLKVRGNIDGVELVKEFLVYGCHPTSDLACLFVTKGESKFRCDNLPEILGNLSHGFECINLGMEE